MASRVARVCVTTAVAILLAGAIFGARAAQAATWQQKAAGTYRWTDAANWDAAFPNSPGAAADLNVGLQGSISLTLDRAITIGTLTAGDRDGAAGCATAIASGTGDNRLTFEGATPGAPTAIQFTLSARPASGYGLNLASGARLGGTSPLTATVSSAAVFDCSVGAVDLNGNAFTLAGPPRTNDGSGATGIAWQVATITGDGQFVLNGAGARLLNPCPNFTGALTINHGWFWFETASLRNASRYTIAGAFTNHKKYPRGGHLQIGAGWPAVTTLPDRLNHQATMVFRGGFLDYRGQALDPSLRGQAVVEQVRQIEFASGMSEISMKNGNDVSSSTTLLANDPANSLVRQQGATLMIGGDDARSAKSMSGAMGVAEKLIFASGVAGFLKGGGGVPGSKNLSIIPWITLGTFYHPGQGKFVTYDRANGIRCLADSEYFTGAVLGCPPDSNVSGAKLNLGTSKAQTINAYTTEAWDNTDIGPGSTLTVASGVIRFGSGPAGIGNGNPANAGTIDFGPAEGIIWTGFDTPYGPNCIGSVIAGTGGLTLAGNNVLVLKAANTYTGKTCVGSGILQVGDGTLTNSRLGNGDVEVAAGGTLRIKTRVANAISDTATVSLGNTGNVFFGVMDLDSGINETVGGLLLDGIAQPAGTYGSSASAAAHKLDKYFAGSGILTVASQKGAAGPSGQAGQQASNPITIKGMVLNNVHTGEKGKSVFVYALDGPPQIKAEVDKILAEHYPDKGLDGDAARKLLDQFTERLKFHITGPQSEELHKNATYGARQVMAVTGIVEERDGKKWIAVSKCEPTAFQYPAGMLAPDKPFAMPDKEPLVLKINDTLSLKCIWVPPGKFLMGEPYYMCPHWQEDPPHMVTLTKGFYLAEHPVTQEMYEAVTGNRLATARGPKAPANVSCVSMYEFCRILSETSGRKVRIPTAAEWDYAARVGTSNPPFAQRYAGQTSDAAMPVKSKAPNAWGFYDMSSTGWERVSDGSGQLDRADTVDPQHIPPEDRGMADKNRKHGHFGKGNAGYAIGEVEYIDSNPGPEKGYPGVIRFRVAVEAPPDKGR